MFSKENTFEREYSSSASADKIFKEHENPLSSFTEVRVCTLSLLVFFVTPSDFINFLSQNVWVEPYQGTHTFLLLCHDDVLELVQYKDRLLRFSH